MTNPFRFEVLKETITRLEAGSGVPDILAGLLDFRNMSIVGHSRGGEVATVSMKAGGLDINRGVSIAPTRFTAVADPTDKKDFLVIYGAYDWDVWDGQPFWLYDAAEGLKHLVFADKANHNFFNSIWAEPDLSQSFPPPSPLEVMPRARHEEVARAYTMAFLLDSFRREKQYREYFLRDPSTLKPPSVTVAADSLSIQSLPPKADNLIVDEHDGTAGTNTLGQDVSGSNLDVLEDVRLTFPPLRRNYYQDTFSGILEFDDIAVYLNKTGATGLDATTYSFVSLRMAQEHDNPRNPRTALDFSVALTDVDGQQSVVDASDFGFTVPPSYRRDDASGASVPGEPNKSHFKTVRIPLWAFTADGRCLNLSAITDVRLIFDKPHAGSTSIQGALGVDDLVFEKGN